MRILSAGGGGSLGGTWRERSCSGHPEGYAKQGSGNGCLFSLGRRFGGIWTDAPFLEPLREGNKFLYFGKFL